MKETFKRLLGDYSINHEKIHVEISANSITVMTFDEEGYNTYGTTFYSAFDAFNFLKVNGFLETDTTSK